MINEKELDKNINALERWMLGDGKFGKLDSQLIGHINIGDRVSDEKKLRALLLWIKTGKHQEITEIGD